MKFLGLVLENYASYYGAHEVPLSDLGLALVLGKNHDEPRASSNGSGKSAPWEALDWCLWGVVPRGDHVDSIINEEAGKNCRVSVRFEDDSGRIVQVERFRKCKDLVGKDSGLRLLIEGTDVSNLDIEETQRQLEIILGLDRDVFHAAILFGQNDTWRFAEGTDSERMEVLTKVLQLGEIDSWLERAKGLVGKVDVDAQQATQAIERVRGEIASWSSMNFQPQIEAWDRDHAAKLALLDQRIATTEDQVRGARQQLPDETYLQNQLVLAAAQKPGNPVLPDDRDLMNVESQLRASLQMSIERVSLAGKRLEKLRRLGVGVCSECGQAVTKTHLGIEESRLMGEVASGDQEQHVLQEQVAGVAKQRGTLRAEADMRLLAYRQALEGYNASVAAIQQNLWAGQQMRTTIASMIAGVEQLQRDRDQVAGQLNPILDQKRNAEGKLRDCQVVLLEHEGRMNGYLERKRLLQFWVDAFGGKGIKSYVLDTRLGEMTDAVNHWVKMLTGGTFWVRLETQTLGRSTGKLSNKINLRVFQYGKDGRIVERNYRSWSGGQKARVSMGVDFGLSRLVAARARQKYDLLILDEVFRHLDRAGREAVVEMLHVLRAEKSSVIVIDHDAEFGAAFERVLYAEIKNRRSILSEVRHAN
jgi:DNA repair exonuclease SbcCD ATPase subunit